MIGGCGEEEPAAPVVEWHTAGCELVRVPQAGTPPQLEAAMGRIEKGGRGAYGESFAGLEVDQPGVRAIVYRVPSGEFDEFIRRSAENVCVVVRDAAHSAKDLAVWHDRVLADLPYWTHQNVRIVTVGARHDGSGVEIGTTDVPHTRSALLARYGAEAPLVFVEQAPVRPLR